MIILRFHLSRGLKYYYDSSEDQGQENVITEFCIFLLLNITFFISRSFLRRKVGCLAGNPRGRVRLAHSARKKSNMAAHKQSELHMKGCRSCQNVLLKSHFLSQTKGKKCTFIYTTA